MRPADEATASKRPPVHRSSSRYRQFWNDVGDRFPDLDGALSTRQYRESEERLFRRFLAPLDGLRIFKTDLWDEAKNTRILRWSAARGAVAYGADLSAPVVRRRSRSWVNRAGGR